MTDDRPTHPDRLGHFRVVEELGQGGMGTVYIGVDDTLDRRVALKVIRSEHRLDPVRKARFLREARILSKLDHPGICQLHDYIEGEDDDCLVLELVNGASLRSVMDDAALTHGQKLAVAGRILDVLVVVHGKGIIHRDLTPLNVMVTPDNGVKVLDFGLAQREAPTVVNESITGEDQDLTSPSREDDESGPHGPWSADVADAQLTRAGTVMGTAGYLSPEQARGQAATAASDMYSFGLLFQELFTGRAPYGDDLDARELLRRAAWAETEPVVGLPADLTALIKRLTSLVPASRPTAVDAAEMLQLIVDGPRRRRKRALVATVWLVLAVFGAGMTIQFLRAERETDRAERHARLAEEEATAARQVSEFLVGLFEVSDPGEGDGTELTARELLDNGAKTIEFDLAEQPVAQSRMLHTMGVVYHHLGDFDRAVEMLEQALEIRRSELGPNHPDVAATLVELCLVHRYLGNLESSRTFVNGALGILESIYGPDAIECFQVYQQIAVLDGIEGEVDASETGYQRCARIIEAQPDPGAYDEQMSTILEGLAGRQMDRGDFAAAEPLLRRALELDERVFGPDSFHITGTLGTLGSTLIRQKKFDEAEIIMHRAHDIVQDRIGVDHPFTARSLNDIAHLHYGQENYSEAVVFLRRALEIYTTVFGTEHQTTAIALQNLGLVLAKQGRLDEAAETTEESLRVRTLLFGDDHPEVAYSTSALATVRHRQGRYDEAIRLHTRALEIRERGLGESSPMVALTLEELAASLREAGRETEALECEERAKSIRESSHPSE